MRYIKEQPVSACESETGLTDAGYGLLVEYLEALPQSHRPVHALKLAAQLVEFSAYELAGKHTATYVADLVHNAARLDRTSAEVAGTFGTPARGTVRRVQ